MKAGKTQEAIALLQKATILLPDSRHVMADYVLALVWAGESQHAVNYYQSREQELLEISYLHKNIAKAFSELRNFSRARELLAKGWQVESSG